jgi:asparagine synthase (glutamine-hydrolysing)
MCGIAGLANLAGTPVDEALLRRMTRTLAHRGPDGEGVYTDGPIGLGHRRLSIIDLSTGSQPMASLDGTASIVFNGEIYNFRELRAELMARGHAFRTSSDTEVILNAYAAWGDDCVRHLRGMFAFALWDRPRRRLLLARDRAGIKPLVYAWDGQRLLFASELKALLEDRALSRDIDWDAMRDYLTFHYVPGPRTIFLAVRKLPPASYLVLDVAGGRLRIERYWDLRFSPDDRRTDADWLAELRLQLADAVQSHLVSDVPVGAFLSGGMDSSAVVALMAQAGEGRTRTFSIGFDDAAYDELEYARRLAKHYGTDHHEFVVHPDALEIMPELAWQFDEPFADASALPTFYVAKITRKHVTVALSGDGGDENFAGYRRYARAQVLHERLDRPAARSLRSALALAARMLPSGVRGHGWLEMLAAEPVERYFRMVTYRRTRDLTALLAPEVRTRADSAAGAATFRDLARAGQAPDYLSTLQYLDVRTYLPDDILTKVDRTSMLVSLEARVPLLDHRLMEFLATMPARLKLRDGHGKDILKRAMAPDLPPEILARPKMGFGVPIASWLRRELSGWARDILLGPRLRQRGWLQTRATAQLLQEHLAGQHDRSAQIWAILCLEEWARRWIDAA